jgi:hypothetical protein
MQAILGVLFHSLGGVAAGSFYMPYNKVKGWSWETYWMVGGVVLVNCTTNSSLFNSAWFCRYYSK